MVDFHWCRVCDQQGYTVHLNNLNVAKISSTPFFKLQGVFNVKEYPWLLYCVKRRPIDHAWEPSCCSNAHYVTEWPGGSIQAS